MDVLRLIVPNSDKTSYNVIKTRQNDQSVCHNLITITDNVCLIEFVLILLRLI